MPPEFPYPCPSCGADLEERDVVIGWITLPERLTGHFAAGSEGGIQFVVDHIAYNPPPRLQCFSCGEYLDGKKDFRVEDVYLDTECEIEEPEDEDPEGKV